MSAPGPGSEPSAECVGVVKAMSGNPGPGSGSHVLTDMYNAANSSILAIALSATAVTVTTLVDRVSCLVDRSPGYLRVAEPFDDALVGDGPKP